MHALWSHDVAILHNDHAAFDSVISYPKPVHRSVPVAIGGSCERAARRGARPADGYFPGGDLDAGGLAHRIGLVHTECEALERDPADVELTVYASISDPDALSARIEELTALEMYAGAARSRGTPRTGSPRRHLVPSVRISHR
jgi:alkanesulfonate monooxygenase SsuD/methylene tetrahydromethanopterin reductase-like flavin-dependent oxidoreductase (luciferase family)